MIVFDIGDFIFVLTFWGVVAIFLCDHCVNDDDDVDDDDHNDDGDDDGDVDGDVSDDDDDLY